jgi:sterol carrier protein 2
MSGIRASQIDVAEVHDCFSCNELFMYEALGFCPRGQGVQFMRNGKWIANKDGGEVYRSVTE